MRLYSRRHGNRSTDAAMYRMRTVYRSAGFSLIELLVVMAIVAMMALIGVPWFVKIGQRNQVKSAANEIQSTLLAARMIAVKINQPVSVVVTAASPTDQVHLLEIMEPNPPPGTSPRRTYIQRMAVSFITPPTTSTITFVGDGRVSLPAPPIPGVIVIRGPVGVANPNDITIQAESNGRVFVITPTAWN